jgi:hypothetical protein
MLMMGAVEQYLALLVSAVCHVQFQEEYPMLSVLVNQWNEITNSYSPS